MAVTIDWLVSSVVHWSHGGEHGVVGHGVVGHVGQAVELAADSSQEGGETEGSLGVEVGLLKLTGTPGDLSLPSCWSDCAQWVTDTKIAPDLTFILKYPGKPVPSLTTQDALINRSGLSFPPGNREQQAVGPGPNPTPSPSEQTTQYVLLMIVNSTAKVKHGSLGVTKHVSLVVVIQEHD